MGKYKIELVEQGLVFEFEGDLTIEQTRELEDVTLDGVFGLFEPDTVRQFMPGRIKYEISGHANSMTWHKKKKKAKNAPPEN